MLDESGLAIFGVAFVAGLFACTIGFSDTLTAIADVAAVRRRRSVLAGVAAGIFVLLAASTGLGWWAASDPSGFARPMLVTLLLLFGFRSLRTATLRAAGAEPAPHDPAASIAWGQPLRARRGPGPAFDDEAAERAYRIVIIDGLPIAFVVVAIGAGAPGLMLSAVVGIVGGLLLVVFCGANIPALRSPAQASALHMAAGALLSALGTYWAGDFAGASWPGDQAAVAVLALGYFATAIGSARFARHGATRIQRNVGT